jgi:hypothetical protein
MDQGIVIFSVMPFTNLQTEPYWEKLGELK